MAQEDRFIPIKDFIATIARIYKNPSTKRRIFFILGAGASVEAKIPGAGSLAKRWLEEMKESNLESANVFIAENGITAANIANKYSIIFKERFRHDPDERWEYMEGVIDQKTPNYGYSVLSQIMAGSAHNVIITTNFDHLAEQSIHTFTGKTPLVCGHESLAHFARPSNTRPLIIKVHNDLLFAPKNEAEETEKLTKSWEESFNKLFSNNDQIVLVALGYGGNDGSLMDFLKNIPKLSNLFWCLYEEEPPSSETLELIEKQNGKLIKTKGFDAVMLQLHVALGLPDLSEEIIVSAQKSKTAYDNARIELSQKIQASDNEELKATQKEAAGKSKADDWVSYQLRVNAAKDNDEKERIYKEGIEKLPNEAKLIGNFALFLTDIRKDHDGAEQLYKKALELDPNDAINTGSYALFLKKNRKDHDGAELLYKKALELDPNNAINTGNYAVFLETILKNYDKAEQLYKKALELDPNHANTTGNYALFLTDIRKDHDGAEQLYKKALELDPNNANTTGNYAFFLTDIRKDHDGAELLYKRALELDPNDSDSNANYAQLLIEKGQKELASSNLNTAMKNAAQQSTLLEIHYYYYANYPEHREASLKELKRLIAAGARSPNWDFSPNIELAKKEGHPDLPLLQRLAVIIANDAAAEGL
jgi:protein O-mannosyl-transferase